MYFLFIEKNCYYDYNLICKIFFSSITNAQLLNLWLFLFRKSNLKKFFFDISMITSEFCWSSKAAIICLSLFQTILDVYAKISYSSLVFSLIWFYLLRIQIGMMFSSAMFFFLWLFKSASLILLTLLIINIINLNSFILNSNKKNQIAENTLLIFIIFFPIFIQNIIVHFNNNTTLKFFFNLDVLWINF